MKHHNQLRSGSLLTYVQMTLNIIVSIAYTPFMLRILGKSEYGLYSTVASTIAILSVLSLGFGGSYVRYYILYRKEKADDKIARLNGLFLIVFSVIGLIALACGLYLTFHLEMVFKTGLTDAEYHTARILMLLLTANLAVSFPMSVFSNIISAQEQFVFLKATEILGTVVSPLRYADAAGAAGGLRLDRHGRYHGDDLGARGRAAADLLLRQAAHPGPVPGL